MATAASFVWRPSRARVAAVDGFGPFVRGTSAPASLSWPAKDPNDILDYVFDVSDALLGDGGDSIVTLDVQITPAATGDLTLRSVVADGERAVLWLAAGQPGTTYEVTIVIGTTAGRTLLRSVNLPVLTMGTPAMALGVLTDQTGAALTDENGQPLLSG